MGQAAKQIEPTAPRGIAGKRVFVVEDEALIAFDIEMILEGKGCQVVGPAGRLDRAIDLAESEAFDLAVLDVMIGPDEIFPLASILAERGVPFVFHSGHAHPADLCALFPEAGFVCKPSSPARLTRALEAAAEG